VFSVSFSLLIGVNIALAALSQRRLIYIYTLYLKSKVSKIRRQSVSHPYLLTLMIQV